MKPDDLLPIGQLAHATGLSVTALRHYDQAGVLRPAHVDPASGYRYYRPEQVEQARLVRLLRELSVAVERLPDLLATVAAGGDIIPALTQHIDGLAGRVAVQRQVLAHLRDRLPRRREEPPPMDVVLDRLPAGPVLARTVEVGLAELWDVVLDIYVQLYAAAGHGPLTFTTSAFLRYHGQVDRGDTTRIDVCLPFNAQAAWPRDLPDGITVLEIPDEPFASTLLRGDAAAFPAVMDGYAAVSSWMTRHGFSYAGPAYEIYRRWCGVAGHPDNELVVGFPVLAD